MKKVSEGTMVTATELCGRRQKLDELWAKWDAAFTEWFRCNLSYPYHGETPVGEWEKKELRLRNRKDYCWKKYEEFRDGGK